MMLILIVTTTFLLAAVVLAGLRFARRMPQARAWDPNSHDKITFQAINMLAGGQNGKLTLMGWMLRETRAAPRLTFFKTAAESQIRRGAIEEDMNSCLVTHFVYDYLPFHFDSLEAPNGAYHFFNGITQSGLTDSSVLTRTFGKTVSGCTSPLPSAYQRASAPAGSGLDPGQRYPRLMSAQQMEMAGPEAFDKPMPYLCSTGEWHLDDEGRNYSFIDSEQYFRDSYTHLSFYSIGRIAHLLDDMALPGHVRDDSHAGTIFQNVGFDPSDPVEVIADMLDMAAAPGSGKADNRSLFENINPIDPAGSTVRIERLPGGDYDFCGIHKWAFNPIREYSGTPNETAWGAFTRLRQAGAGKGKVDGRSLFAELARDTHDRYYSFNTIPGNIASHDPETSVKTPFERTGAVEWGKCDVELDALWPVLQQFCWEARLLTSTGIHANRSGNTVWLNEQTADIDRFLGSEYLGGLKDRSGKFALIIGIGNRKVPLSIEKVRKILNALPDWQSLAMNCASPPPREAICTQDDINAMNAAVRFMNRYQDLEAVVLIKSVNDNSDLKEALKKWINDHSNPANLRDAFQVQTTGYQSHGPCCLTESIVLATIEDRQAMAAGTCAYLFSKWFESLYNSPPSGRKPGMAVWLNKLPSTETEPPKIDPIAVLPNVSAGAKDAAVANDAALFAIANHLPMPLNYTIEITLIEGADETDEDLCKSGVQLDLQWGHLFPELPAITRAGTCAAQELNDYLADLGGGGGKAPPWAPKALETITLGGMGPDGKKRSGPARFQLDDVAPYNLESLVRVVLAPGKWSPGDRDMGGILRKDEAATLIPVPAWPDQTTNRDKMTASILRITPSEAPATPTKSDASPAPAP